MKVEIYSTLEYKLPLIPCFLANPLFPIQRKLKKVQSSNTASKSSTSKKSISRITYLSKLRAATKQKEAPEPSTDERAEHPRADKASQDS